ncbi:MAG: PKD domain-containing protein [Pseudomonadales bacterium]
MLILSSCVAGCGGDGSVRICFGSHPFCDRALGRNLAPLADAGVDQQVASGAVVRLDGRGSRDPDGHITSFSWVQETGPTVALEGATSPTASFRAPEVTAPTILRFRLVVTDDASASDVARVEVTVSPRHTLAVQRGLRLLQDPLRPSPDGGVAGCRPCHGFLGLWLGARVQAASTGWDHDVDALLDELRVIAILHGAAPWPASVPGELRLLEHMGQRAVAAFTARRDPATAALARQRLEYPEAASAAGLEAEQWVSAIAAALPDFSHGGASLAELQQQSERLLLGQLDGVRPEEIAAATLLLALSPPPQP